MYIALNTAHIPVVLGLVVFKYAPIQFYSSPPNHDFSQAMQSLINASSLCKWVLLALLSLFLLLCF